MGWHILKYIHTHIGKYTYTYSHIYIYLYIYIYKIYFAENEKQDICIYIYLWQGQFLSKVKHVITYKEESLNRKALASIIANMVNIMKRCYSKITSTTTTDATDAKKCVTAE